MSFINNENLLTAIVPVRNMAGRLNVFNSWIGQIEKYPMQLIVVHDVFDKDTDYELKKIIDHHSHLNIVLIEGKFGSPGYARNAGFEYVTGKWVAFWDSDDKPRLQTIIREINNAQLNDDVLVGGFDTINAFSGNVNRLNENNASLRSVLMNPGLWRMVIKFSLITKPFPPYRMGEDQIFIIKNQLLRQKIFFDESTFYKYFTNVPNQLTSKPYLLNDLLYVLVDTLLVLKNEKRKNKIIDVLFSVRQFMTIQKKCSWQTRLVAIKIYFSFILGWDISKFEKRKINEI